MDISEEVMYEIILDLHWAYYALYLKLCLDILVAHQVGTRALQLLQRYWDSLLMVARYWGYFVTPFKGYYGVTQGDPLSPIIFNVVVDAVLIQWVTVVVSMEEAVDPGASDKEGVGWGVQRLEAYIYDYDGIFVLTRAARLQWDFDTLT